MRRLALLAVIGILLFTSGPSVDCTPWNRLETLLNRLGIEEINYQAYCFLPENGSDAGGLGQRNSQGRPPRWQPRLLAMDSGSSMLQGGAVKILQVTGNDHRACWKGLQGQLFTRESFQNPLVWMVEAQLKGDEADLRPLAEELLSGLSAKLHSVYRDEATINMVAYVPGFKTQLMMEGLQ